MKALRFIPIICLLIACSNTGSEMYSKMPSETDGSFADMEVPITEQPDSRLSGNNQAVSKKVVKTGGIDFQSEDIAKDYQAIQALLPKHHAYIEDENQSKTTHRINYSVRVRVPSIAYDSLFNSLSGIASRLDSKYSSIEDVTERYYDLKARIKNKKALEQRYTDLLTKANEIKDMLEIEKNLNQVRTDIERLEGQFNFLSKQVSLSTIQLNFYEVLPYAYDSTQRKGLGARILSSIDGGWQGFLSFLVGLIGMWPAVILFIVGIYLFRKYRSKRKSKG